MSLKASVSSDHLASTSLKGADRVFRNKGKNSGGKVNQADKSANYNHFSTDAITTEFDGILSSDKARESASFSKLARHDTPAQIAITSPEPQPAHDHDAKSTWGMKPHPSPDDPSSVLQTANIPENLESDFFLRQDQPNLDGIDATADYRLYHLESTYNNLSNNLRLTLVNMILVRAKIARLLAEWQALEDHATRAHDLATPLNSRQLIAYCRFFQGIALYNLRQWTAAGYAFDDAGACADYYISKAELNAWCENIRGFLAQLHSISPGPYGEGRSQQTNPTPFLQTENLMDLRGLSDDINSLGDTSGGWSADRELVTPKKTKNIRNIPFDNFFYQPAEPAQLVENGPSSREQHSGLATRLLSNFSQLLGFQKSGSSLPRPASPTRAPITDQSICSLARPHKSPTQLDQSDRSDRFQRPESVSWLTALPETPERRERMLWRFKETVRLPDRETSSDGDGNLGRDADPFHIQGVPLWDQHDYQSPVDGPANRFDLDSEFSDPQLPDVSEQPDHSKRPDVPLHQNSEFSHPPITPSSSRSLLPTESSVDPSQQNPHGYYDPDRRGALAIRNLAGLSDPSQSSNSSQPPSSFPRSHTAVKDSTNYPDPSDSLNRGQDHVKSLRAYDQNVTSDDGGDKFGEIPEELQEEIRIDQKNLIGENLQKELQQAQQGHPSPSETSTENGTYSPAQTRIARRTARKRRSDPTFDDLYDVSASSSSD